MLILSHSSIRNNDNEPKLYFAQRNDERIVEEFNQLSNDELLQDKGIMLVTVDATNNRMLAARMAIDMK